MNARLEEFLDEDSAMALAEASVAVDVREADRAAVAVIFPGPAPEPMTAPPVVQFPDVPAAEPRRRRLERLQIDYVHVARKTGEPCPTCARPLRFATVVYPDGVRPLAMPESGWRCEFCRQYYMYREVLDAAVKAS